MPSRFSIMTNASARASSSAPCCISLRRERRQNRHDSCIKPPYTKAIAPARQSQQGICHIMIPSRTGWLGVIPVVNVVVVVIVQVGSNQWHDLPRGLSSWPLTVMLASDNVAILVTQSTGLSGREVAGLVRLLHRLYPWHQLRLPARLSRHANRFSCDVSLYSVHR